MEYRPLGRTGLKVSKLSLGGSPLGRVTTAEEEAEAIRTVHAALDLGINLIDTSPYYSATKAETVLGRALRGVRRDRYLLATKVGRYGLREFDLSAARVLRSFEESRARLGVETIDLLHCHDIEFGDLRQVAEETLPALATLRAAGKIRFIGITGLPLKIFPAILDRVPPGTVDVVLSYCHYNLNDDTLAGLLPRLKRAGVGVIHAAPDRAGDADRRPAHPSGISRPQRIKDGCKRAVDFCRERGCRYREDGGAVLDLPSRHRHHAGRDEPGGGDPPGRRLCGGSPGPGSDRAGAGDTPAHPQPQLLQRRAAGEPGRAHLLTMLQIVLEKPGQFAARDVPDPVPAGQALVRVHRIGVCGTDLHAFRGRQPFFNYPRVLGHELGVEVIDPGDKPGDLAAGDRCAVEPYLNCGRCSACRAGRINCCSELKVLGVHTDGGMGPLLAIPAAKLHRSRKLSCDQLALVEMLGIGAHAVERAAVTRDDFVLVLGAGPIGLSVIQFVQAAGATLAVADVSAARLEFCGRLGVNHLLSPGPDLADRLRAIGGDLPGVVFDATGNAASMAAAFTLPAQGGRIVFVGICQGSVSFDDPNFHRRELTLLASRNAPSATFGRVLTAIESGRVDTSPWVTHRFALADTPGPLPRGRGRPRRDQGGDRGLSLRRILFAQAEGEHVLVPAVVGPGANRTRAVEGVQHGLVEGGIARGVDDADAGDGAVRSDEEGHPRHQLVAHVGRRLEILVRVGLEQCEIGVEQAGILPAHGLAAGSAGLVRGRAADHAVADAFRIGAGMGIGRPAVLLQVLLVRLPLALLLELLRVLRLQPGRPVFGDALDLAGEIRDRVLVRDGLGLGRVRRRLGFGRGHGFRRGFDRRGGNRGRRLLRRRASAESPPPAARGPEAPPP